MPNSARDIRAGGAFVEITARDGAFMKGLGAAQGKLRAFAASCQSIGSSLLAVSAGMVAPFGLAASAFGSFDDAMRSVQAVTGSTGAEFDALSAKARALGASTSYTAKEAADAMGALGRSGFKSGQIDDAISSVLSLARATGTDLARSADIVSNALNMFGLSAEKAGDAADVLVATANNSAQTLDDLFEALKMVGPQAKAAGYDIRETSAALGILANVGIKGSMAGNAVKRALQQFADPATQGKLAAIRVAVKDAEGNLRALPDIFRDLAVKMNALPTADKLALAKDIFDVRASGAGLALAANAEQLDAFLAKLRDVTGAASDTATAMDAGLGGSLRILKSAVEAVQLALGKAIEGPLKEWVDWAKNGATALAAWIERHQKLASVIGAVAASVAGFTAGVLVLGKVSYAFSATAHVVKVVATAITACTARMAAATATGRALAFSFGSVSSASATLAGIQTALAAKFGATAVAAGAAVASFAAVAAVAVGLLAVFAKMTRYTAKLSDEAERALEQGDAQRAQDREKLSRLQELSEHQRLAADEQREAAEIVADLESHYGKLGITINDTTGAIEGLAAAQERVNEAMRKAALADVDAKIAESRNNIKELEKDTDKATSSWVGAYWDYLKSGFDSNVLSDRVQGNFDEMNVEQKKLEALLLRRKVLEERAAAASKSGSSTRLAATRSVLDAANKLAEIEEEARRDALTGTEREIDAIRRKREEYDALVRTMLEFEQSQPEAVRDAEKIAALTAKLRESAARSLAAEFGAQAKAADAVRGAIRSAADEYAAERAQREDDRALDVLSRSDPAAYAAEVQRRLSVAQGAAAAAFGRYNGAADAALEDGRLTDAEKASLEALLDAYRAAEEQVDRFAERLERAGEGAERADSAARTSAVGSFYAAQAAAMAQGFEARIAAASELAVKWQKRIYDFLKEGGAEIQFE